MPQALSLIFEGALAPNNRLSARTLGHTVPHLQRAIDKIVFFEQFGRVRKFSTLPADLYPGADIYIQQFEAGSIRIPFVNEFVVDVVQRLRQHLTEPYVRAAADIRKAPPLDAQVTAAVNRLRNNQEHPTTQERLIADQREREGDWLRSAVLSDINTMLSPLRSSKLRDDAVINLRLADDERTRDYTFDAATAKNFGKIVREKSLGPTTYYTGHLRGLRENNSPTFPYIGDFLSSTTDKMFTLFIGHERAAQRLNRYNLSPAPLTIIGAPLTIYGAFDEVRGDVVFITVAQ